MSWAVSKESPAAQPDEGPRDEDWFVRVYDETFDTVYHLARTLVRDHEGAQDIVAETYLRVWQARDTLCGQRTLLAWVMAITHNCAMDNLRARRPSVSLDLFDSIGDPGGAESPGPRITESDAEAIRRAITKLSQEQQQVIFLRFYQELPHEAVAAKLGKSPIAIRQIQFRALVRLRKLLQEDRSAG